MGYRSRLPLATLSRRGGPEGQAGFTLVEVLIYLAIATLVAGGLYQVLIFQQRAYRHEGAAIERQDALRLGAAVLAADLMEASVSEGDLAALGADSLVVRSPVGFAIVCAADSTNDTLALFDVAGRMSAQAGDSLLIYRPGGWLVRAIETLNPNDAAALDCPYSSGPAAELRLEVGGSVNGVPVGAPARAFHRYVYRLVQDGGGWWLARDDGDGPEILVGPFDGTGSGLAFSYLDGDGQVTGNPSQVARIDMRLVALAGTSGKRADTLAVSVRPRNR